MSKQTRLNIPRSNNLRRCLSALRLKWRFARAVLGGCPPYTTEIDLERVLLGEICGTSVGRWAEMTGQWYRVSCLLKDSPYVHFLQAVAADESRIDDDAFLESQSYYRMAVAAVRLTGSYFAATEPTAIKRQMRGYYEMFKNIRDGRSDTPGSRDYRHSSPGSPVMMLSIKNANCYEIDEGHHRSAVYYVLGRRSVAALVIGEKPTYLQQLIGQAAPNRPQELEQPIDTIDVRDWRVRQDCSEHLQRILKFLGQQGWTDSVETVLDASCGYGWIVNQLQQRNYQAVGVTPIDAHVRIGRVAYGLDEHSLRPRPTGEALRHSDSQNDVVLLLNALHRYVLGEMPEQIAEILRLLDRATKRVLFLDWPDESQSRSQQSLSGWNDERIRSTILDHTSFAQVIPLGSDGDGQCAFSDQVGRTMFACIRQTP